MQNNHDGLKAQSLLKTFEEEGGIDPRCYFASVADSLLGRFGERAIAIAAEAVRKMHLLGDQDGREMWEAVSDQIWTRIGDHLDVAPGTLVQIH